MNVKTNEAIGAYNALKQIKVSSLSDNAADAAWENIKTISKVAVDFDETANAAKSAVVNDDEFKSKQNEYAELTAKADATDEDKTKLAELKAYFDAKNNQFNAAIKKLLDKEIDIDIIKIKEAELLKAIKDAGLKFEVMEILKIVME